MKTEKIPSKGEVIIYQDKYGKAKLEVTLERETVWLTQKQLSQLFNAERSVITKHLRSIFIDKELNKNTVCAKIAHTV